MSKSLLAHIFNVREIQYRSTQYSGNTVLFKAETKKSSSKCRNCDSRNLIFKGKKSRVFHLPPAGRKRCKLELLMHRLYCKDCHELFWPRLHFMKGESRYTRSFALTVLDFMQFATILDTARYFNVGWDLIKNIHKEKLKVMYRRKSLVDLVYLGIDEFSLRKGHTYMTIFVDLQTGRIIHAVEGRSAEVVAPFLKKIKRHAKKLNAVAIDMSRSYIKALSENLGDIDIVFDRYHVTALVNKAVDVHRKNFQENVEKEEQKHLKGSRFLFLSNFNEMKQSSKEKLQCILEMHKSLSTAYILKEYLRKFWEFSDVEKAKNFLVLWCDLAHSTSFPSFVTLAKTIKKHQDGILNFFKYRITNATVEGTNNKIKTLKRQVYGFRDVEYLKLRLYHLHTSRYAFAG